MSRLYSNYPPASKRTSNRPPISKKEYKMLDTICLGPGDGTTLRKLAHRSLKFATEWERAAIELNRQPARHAQLVEEYENMPYEEGAEHVFLGRPNARSTHYTSGSMRWEDDAQLLFDTLESQDKYLSENTPSTIEQWFWHSAVSFGAYNRLRTFVAANLSQRKKAYSAFTRYYYHCKSSRQACRDEPGTPPNKTEFNNVASAALATPPPEPVLRIPSQRQTGAPSASSAQAPRWQHHRANSIMEHNVRKHVFRFTFPHPGGSDPGTTNVNDGTSSDDAGGTECIWKVVNQTSPDEGPAMYTVAFDWKSPFETQEDLVWADVESLINLPTSYYHKL